MRRITPVIIAAFLAGCPSDDEGSQVTDEGLPCDTDADCEGVFPELRQCEAAVCERGQCEIGAQPDGTECRDALACTSPDYCLEGQCTGTVVRCDDDDPCTKDSCDNKTGCLFTPTSGTECDDGNACTAGDICQSGSCQSGEPIEGCCRFNGDCEDDDPCTDNVCDAGTCAFPFNFAPCDDENPCTGPDHCDGAGACGGDELSCEDGNPCTADSCDPETGECVSDVAEDGTACEDGNPCTQGDVCTAGECDPGESQCACTTDADCVPLEDGDLCNGTLICSNLNCIVDPLTVVACNPTGDTTCRRNTCDPETGQCRPVAAADGLTCNDQNPCTTADQCQNGLCLGAPLSCDDDNPCTFDACSPVDGCQHSDNNLSCSDGSACTVNDQCNGGACVGIAENCDDQNPCTDDTCDDDLGCIHTPNSAPCDVDPCTTDDFCEGGECKAGSTTICVPCDDNDDCVQFDDGNFCNGTLVCVDGGCVPDATTVVQCDTSGDTTCSKTRCTPATGACDAVPTANGTACSDGSSCTLLDQCQDGLCVGDQVECDDNNPCTDDACDPAVGCRNVANTASCDDSNACTSNDRCSNGACAGSQIICDDGNECTIDSCDVVLGCRTTNAPASTICNDGSDCTSNDHCENGSCTGTGLICNDGNPCTLDNCDPVNGCSFPNAPSSQGCDDGSACTTSDHCSNGSCTGTTITCDDGNECTTDSCNAASGCTTTNVDNGDGCDDGDACTDPDTCQNGVCTGGADICVGCNTEGCPDPGQCKTVECNTDTGECEITNLDTGSCDDGDECTDGDQCSGGNCAGTPIDVADVCDDGNECTDDGCDPATGCTNANVVNGSECADLDLCDGTETCTDGVCSTSGTTLECDDGKECTDDTCIPATGCQYTNDDTNTCSDGDSCSDDVCDAGTCVSSTINCNDADACTTDSCVDGACQNVQIDCDDGNACTTNDCDPATGCVYEPIDCSDGDPCTDDNCSDGVCSNPDNGSCDGPEVTCGTGTLADVESNNDGTFDPVFFDATATGTGLTYAWTVTGKPSGSSAQPLTPTSEDTWFTADIAGTYELTITVTDGNGLTASCTYTFNAVPSEELRIELVWDENWGDADLHLAHPDAVLPGHWFHGFYDCYFASCAGGNGINWGANGPSGNPVLDTDDTAGLGPENINIDTNPESGTYTVAISYYCSDSIVGKGGNAAYEDGGPAEAIVRIHCTGTTTEITNLDLDQSGRFIVVATVEWPSCNVSESVRKSQFVGDVETGPGLPTRCQRVQCGGDGDCLSGESCETLALQGGGTADLCYLP